MVTRSLANGVPFAKWSCQFSRFHLDLGTGDGTYVVRRARADCRVGVVGIDTCLDHLRGATRHYPPNAIFLRADARTLPLELGTRFEHVTINFPFGSLLEAIRDGDAMLRNEIDRVTTSGATLDVVINESALVGLGLRFEDGGPLLRQFAAGLPAFRGTVREMTSADLRAFPSAWSKKMAYGRNPRAVRLIAATQGSTPC